MSCREREQRGKGAGSLDLIPLILPGWVDCCNVGLKSEAVCKHITLEEFSVLLGQCLQTITLFY